MKRGTKVGNALFVVSVVADVMLYLVVIGFMLVAGFHERWSQATYWLVLAVWLSIRHEFKVLRERQGPITVTLDGNAMERAILRSRRERGLS